MDGYRRESEGPHGTSGSREDSDQRLTYNNISSAWLSVLALIFLHFAYG